MSRTASPLRDRVVFLVGVRRSGTNWLRRIVDAHPDASVIPAETYLLSHGIAPLRERVQHGLTGSARTGTMFVDREDFLDAVRDLCDRLLGSHLDTLDHPVRVLAERTPDHVNVLDLIADVYPDAAVVHIIRDGRDVARSLVSQPWGPDSYRDAAAEWVSGIESARQHAPRLARYHEVHYERLLADPAHQVAGLYRFLGLDDSEHAVRGALLEADVPYNVDPLHTAVTAEKWRGTLDADELAQVLEVAAPLLTDLGYDPGGAPRTSASIRSLVRRTVGAAAGVRDRRDDAAFERAVLGRFDHTMAVLDRLLDDVVAGRYDDLGRHFAPDPRISVIDGADSWDQRGPEAVARLADTWSSDPALRGRQLRGDVHPGVPGFTVVFTWGHDGASHDRVLVLTSYGEAIAELVWYVLPRVVGDDGRRP